MARAGCIPHLITWLQNPNAEVQVKAARAMLAVASNNVTTQALIGKLGGIPPLIALVRNALLEAQEHACCCLWHLATDENRSIIYIEGASKLTLHYLEGASQPSYLNLHYITSRAHVGRLSLA